MTILRHQMIAEMRSQNLPGGTQKAYIEEIAALAGRYGVSPDLLQPEQIRTYLQQEAMKLIAPKIEAFRFFYTQVLDWEWDAERRAICPPPPADPWAPTDPLRCRMQGDLGLWNLAPRTRQEYDRWVGKFARFCQQSPAKLGAEHVRAYLVHLMDVEHKSPSSFRVASAALRFLYAKTLNQTWAQVLIPLPKRERTLPIILSLDEAATYIEAAGTIKDQAIVMTLYGTGIRTTELCGLRVFDVDNQRMQIRIEQGKGRKDRYVMLSPRLLEKLNEYRQTVYPMYWLFPQPDGSAMSADAVRTVCRRVEKAAGLSKQVTPRTLRHCFATHLLESGERIERIQLLMGHRSGRTTMVYIHMATSTICSGKSPLDLLPPK